MDFSGKFAVVIPVHRVKAVDFVFFGKIGETFTLFRLGAFLVKINNEPLANKEILLYYW